MEFALVAAALLLAFVNGANDNVKAVATLHGSGSLGFRSAMTLATLAQVAGSLASILIATALVRAFSGKGLVPPEVLNPGFLTAVAAGAALTVLVATRVGMPISTTHAIVGGLVGAGAVLAGSALNAAALGTAFLLPLAVGPLFAVALAWLFAQGGSSLASRLGLDANSCVCVEAVPVPVSIPLSTGGEPTAGATVARAALQLQVDVAHRDDCAARNAGRVLGVDVATAIDIGHGISASTVGFARGLNDTPKILGLLVGASVVDPTLGAIAIAAAMALGGILAARRVAVTLSHRITPMQPARGLAGNLATAALVIGASRLGLPMSTTHVSTGGIFGIGASGGTLQGRVASQIVGSWLATLPLAAGLAAIFAWLLP